MYKLIFLYQVWLCRGYIDSLCMDGAEVSMACRCSTNRSCPCCWCFDSQLHETHNTCEYRKEADVFAQVEVALDELLDDDENVLQGIKMMSRRLRTG